MKLKTWQEFMSHQRQKQEQRAALGMTHPNADPFQHGVAVGTYQGTEQVLMDLENFLKPSQED